MNIPPPPSWPRSPLLGEWEDLKDYKKKVSWDLKEVANEGREILWENLSKLEEKCMNQPGFKEAMENCNGFTKGRIKARVYLLFGYDPHLLESLIAYDNSSESKGIRSVLEEVERYYHES